MTRPYQNLTRAYDADPVAAADTYYATRHSYYGGSGGSSAHDPPNYFESIYLDDPLERIFHQGAPGAAFAVNANDIVFHYEANTATDLPNDYPTANTLNKVRQVRHEGTIDFETHDFYDTFGNRVATITDAGGSHLNNTTIFKYDAQNNLLEVKHPKAPLTSTYEYDTLNQLTRKTTPDADPVAYLYDKSGRLRFVKDGKGESATPQYFIYYKYDKIGRTIEEGTMSDPINNFIQSNADDPAYPSSGHTVKAILHYDFAAYSPSAPQNNLAGRLEAVEYWNERFAIHGYDFYSYDVHGNVEWLIRNIPVAEVSDGNGYLNAKLEYEYDLQNKVTKTHSHRTWPPGAGNNHFYVWYEYDERGRLARVLSHEIDDKTSATENASYTYWPGDQLKRLELGGTVQGLDYLYNQRDWLTQLNHQNLSANDDPGNDGSNGFTLDRFGQVIGYDEQLHLANDPDFSGDFEPRYHGNITWTIHNTKNNVDPAGLTGWVFKYDRADRLKKANWGY